MTTKVQSKLPRSIKQIARSQRTVRTGGTAADFMRKIAEEMENLPAETWEGIPTDVSKNVDHYLYGSTKRNS